MELKIPGCPQVFSQLNLRFRVFLNYIKVQFKEKNPLIDIID